MQDFRLRRSDRFWPYLLCSGCVHVGVFLAIASLIGSQVESVRRQEAVFIQSVQAEEQRMEAETHRAREATVKDLLSGQLQAEMDSLIADEVPLEQEQALSDLTEQHIEQQVDAADQELALDELLDEEIYSLLDDIRGQTLDRMRVDLTALTRDLLVSQVRHYIRTRVAPDIKYSIDQRLKNEIGQRIQSETDRQSFDEKYHRIRDVKTELDKAIRNLDWIGRRQKTVADEAGKRRMSSARRAQDDVRERAPANLAGIDELVATAARLSPEAAKSASALLEDDNAEALMAAVGDSLSALNELEAAVEAEKPAEGEERPEPRESLETATKAAAETAAGTADRLSARAAALREFSDQIYRISRERTPDEIQRLVVAQALDSIDDELRERVRKEVADKAIPKAADRIMEVLKPELETRRLYSEEFRDFLQADMRKALAQELEENEPESDLGLTRTRERYQFRERASLEDAREAVRALLEKMDSLIVDQETLRDEVIKESAEKDAARQRALAGRIEAVKKNGARALRTVRSATIVHDRPAYDAIRSLESNTAERRAFDAAGNVERELVDEAKEQMAEAEGALRKSVEALRKLDAGLAEEAEAIQPRALAELDLNDRLGEEAAEAAVSRVEEAAGKVMDERLARTIEDAGNRVEVRYVLREGPDVATLSRMSQLQSKLDQVAENIEAGRELDAMPGLAMPGPGLGTGLGGAGGSDGIPWAVRHRQELSRFNREAYEEFVKKLRYRMNPDNYYAEAGTVEGEGSVADGVADDGPAAIYVNAMAGPDEDPEQERAVPVPDFPFTAFGAAAMMEQPVVIDGDLSDWGELRHPLTMQYRGDSLEKIEDGPQVYVRWSPDGLYVGYTLRDEDGIQPCEEHPWSGDCLEMMVDMANSRLPEAYGNIDAQKFCFTPFGCRGSTDVTVWEMGRGLRGMGMAMDYPDLSGRKGDSAARIIPGYGYSVECFLSRKALVKPLLLPGRYVALNFSVNQKYSAGTQWSASQQLQTWRRPDTWGDVLLLGSDAEIRFFLPEASPGEDADGIVPGRPLGVEITDADMNLNTLRTDQVAAELVVRDTPVSLFLVLSETGHNTGVFRGSVNTQPYFMGPRGNTVNMRGGDTLQVIYVDARAEYGEKNRRVTADLPVGFPVLRFASQ